MSASRYAVFGHPISHSLSPRIHQAFGQQFAQAVDYQAIDADDAMFETVVAGFFADGGAGANITLPYKARALAMADEVSAQAQRMGAANVLTRLSDGRLSAHNTDGSGFLRDLTERHRLSLSGQHALLLGAGGAAGSAACALLDAGVASLTIVNRSPARAQALVESLDQPARTRSADWSELAQLGGFDLIIHATSAGVLGEAISLPHSLASARAHGYDLSYGAAAGSFLAWAQAAGALSACDGLGMLVEQAADAFELWHGRRPQTEPVYAMLRG